MKKTVLLFLFVTLSILSFGQSSKKVAFLLDQGSSSAPPEFVEPTPPSSDLTLKFNLYELSSMFQERSVFSGGIPVTEVTANTNPVGTIFDQSLSTTFLRATGATTIPLLSADGITFDGTNDMMEVPNSTSLLKSIHAVGSVWSIRFWVKKNVDGTARPLMNNQGLSGTQAGFYISTTATNKVRVFIGDATAPVIVDYTSTASLTVASGATPIQVVINGASSKLVIGSTTETFTASVSEGSTVNAAQNLRLGGDGSTFFNGSFAKSIELYNRALTTQELTDYQSFAPVVTSTDFTPVKQWDLDFNDATKIFSDAAETTQITDGGTIRSIVSSTLKPNHSSAVTRKATSASALASPVWRQSVKNGKSVAEFDGTGNNVLTYSEDLWYECGGTSTFFIIIKNNDSSFGSHYINGNPEYGTMTGSNYGGNLAATGDAGLPYSILHHTNGVGPQTTLSRSDDYNIIVIRRKGAVCDMFNQTKTKTTVSNFGKFTSSLIGHEAPAGGGNWDTYGRVVRIIKYVGKFPDAWVESDVDYFKYIYAISGTL